MTQISRIFGEVLSTSFSMVLYPIHVIRVIRRQTSVAAAPRCVVGNRRGSTGDDADFTDESSLFSFVVPGIRVIRGSKAVESRPSDFEFPDRECAGNEALKLKR